MRQTLRASMLYWAAGVIGMTMNSYARADTPNLYEMTGRGTQVIYSGTSLTGEPRLTYATRTQTLTFRGEEVREQRTELGTLVTVTTAFRPDVNFVTLSVLIPDINLQSGPERFATQAIITTHNTPFIAPQYVKGPIQTYEPLTMRGKASLVYYLSPSYSISGTVLMNTCVSTAPPGGCIYPYSDAAIEVWDTSGNVIAKATANVEGLYNVDVTAGSYFVHVVTNGFFPVCPDTKADVPKAGNAVADILCTAIR